ncbi:MAG: HPF/RaiA family ribosome-associated protein [Saprospiraceae bacterium]
MDLIYETVHFNGSDDLERFTRQKMNRIFAKTPEVLRAEVTLFEGAGGHPENQYCEIHLDVPGEHIFVKKNAGSYTQAVRSAVEAALKVLRRKK